MPFTPEDTQIRNLIKRLYETNLDQSVIEKLSQLGDRAVPLLVEALFKPETEVTVFYTWGDYVSHSAFSRICHLLGLSTPESAIYGVSGYVKHELKHFREEAGLLLGKIGTLQCLSSITSLLADEEDNVRFGALVGIRRGIDEKTSSPRFLEQVFDPVSKLVTVHTMSFGELPVEVLLKIDRAKALEFLLRPDIISLENDNLREVLDALNTQKIAVPPELLQPLLKTLCATPTRQTSWILEECLIAYALNPDQDTEGLLRHYLESDNPDLRAAAAKGLLRLQGASTDYRDLYELETQRGTINRSEPQLHVLYFTVYDDEVRNGGHHQYFQNQSGNGFRHALEAMATMGLTDLQPILEEAIAQFGKNGPSEDQDKRYRQMHKLTKAQHEVIRELDSKYYAIDPNVDLLVNLYALENIEAFKLT